MKLFLAAFAVLSACARPPGPTGVNVPDASQRPEADRGTTRGTDMGTDGRAEADTSYDAQFIDAMIAYANYTKELADIGARRAQRDELRIFSQNLAADQTARIAELQNWRGLWFGRAKARTRTLNEAADNLGVPPYEFGVAWRVDAVELDPQHPGTVKDVEVVTGVEQWGPEEQLTALKDLPDEAFDPFFTATLVQHDIWGMQVAHASLAQIQHPELQTLGQEIVTDNLIQLNQVARWRNDWFGAQTEGMAPEQPGTR